MPKKLTKGALATAVNETDLEDRAARQRILNDPEYIQTFRDMWLKGKQGVSVARLKRLLNVEDYAFNRTFEDMFIDVCPLQHWQGMDFQSAFERVLEIKKGNKPANLTEVVKQTCTPQLSNFFHRHHFTFILGRTSVSQV